MDVRCLGFRTDLALLRLAGSSIEDHGDHLVARTPANPTFWWGNFLLLAGTPRPEDAAGWVERFHAAFPSAGHVAIGVDDPEVADQDVFTAHGLTSNRDAVMRAGEVHEPPRPNTEAVCRALESDADWAQHAELRSAAYEMAEDEDYRAFAEAGARLNRERVEAGHGVWMGAFVDGRLDCQMGLLDAGDGLARFQTVETRPSARGRGLAGTLTHVTGRHGLDVMGAHTLVMVADPDYLAFRVYESVGFVHAETQVSWERNPRQNAADNGGFRTG